MRSSFSPRTALAVALLASSLVWAQEAPAEEPAPGLPSLPGFELERLDANPGRGALLVSSGELMVPGSLRLMALGHYQRLPLVLLDQEQRLEVLRHKVVGLLSGSYTVLSWLEVGAQLPVVLWQRGMELTGAELAPPASQGLGTPLLRARVGLLSQRAKQPVDLALDVGLGLPLGSSTALARDSGLRFHSRLLLGGKLGPVRPALEAGVLLHPSTSLTPSGSSQVGGLEIHVGAALSTLSTGLNGELAARAMFPAGSTQASVEVLGGLRYPLQPGVELFALGGPGLGPMAGTPRFRMVLGMSYSMEPPPRFEFLEDAPSSTHLARPPEQAPAESTGAEGRPANVWEFNALTLTGKQEAPAAPEPLDEQALPLEPRLATSAPEPHGQRPFQPGPRERLVLRGVVLFAHASAELPGELPLLDRVALLLQEMPESTTVLVEGHSDTEGSYTFNRHLSLRRAQAVRRYLASRGVPTERLQLRGFGSNWPASTNTTEEGRQLNRRVEIFVLSEPPTPTWVGESPP